ncbi:MAG TPA: dicarboxylate/amino acid:cation symporter [Tepidisphaeraceae bacterium]|jgi:aerobic C4-dicarboxylate transport protein
MAMAKPLHQNLTFQVLTAICIGLLIGYFRPAWGQALQPLGEGFIRLVKMVVGPIIFLTIVVGISTMGDLKKVGRVGGIALLYFEIVTTLALAIGLLVANVVRPGAGIATQSATLAATTQYSQEAQKHSISEFLLNIIPDNIVNAFAKGDLLQILLFSVLFGLAVAALGPRAAGLVRGMERLSDVMFRVVALIMKVAPLGALGAMAYTIGKFGIGSLVPLAKLMGCVYLTMLLFIFVVLGSAARLFGFSLLRYLAFIKEEILLVLGTSSSESALPRMIERLEQLGCGRAVVGMVIPAGYSFNLDGTSIYLSMAVLFIAQAFGIELSFWQQIYLMAILMLTSKGAAAVTGGGFVTLAATLQATHVLPVEGLALLLGVDRFMSEARAITNLIGNGVATICVSKMEGEFDEARYRAAVSGQPAELPTLPAEITA